MNPFVYSAGIGFGGALMFFLSTNMSPMAQCPACLDFWYSSSALWQSCIS